MNQLEKLAVKCDSLQQKHPYLSFPYAVVKKFGEDETAYGAALITYYGFLSLFPLLIAATTITRLILNSHPGLKDRLFAHVSPYVPVIGNELQKNIHGFGQTGFGLVITLLFTIYGTRGVADIIRRSLSNIWYVPRGHRLGFPKSLTNSLEIIFGGGFGLVMASVLSGYTSSLGRSFFYRTLSSLASFIIVAATGWFVLRLTVKRQASRQSILLNAVIAAIGIQILQSIGGYVITHELKHLSNLYGAFALALGLLFWLYLQAQVFLYAAQSAAVYELKLWPRSLEPKGATAADRKALSLQGKRQSQASIT